MGEQSPKRETTKDLHVPPALPESDLKFRRLLEGLPAGAYTCDSEGLITFFNAQAERLWGRAPKLNDPVDRYCGSLKLFAPDGSPIVHDQSWMALALRTQREYNGHEIIIERPDGQRLTVLAHANPLHDESGKLVGAVNVLMDISQRKQQEALSHQRHQEFFGLVERSPDIISRFDRHYRHLYVNPAVERVTGVPAQAFIGKTNAELGMPEVLYGQWQADLREVFTTAQEQSNEFAYPSPDGTIHYHARLIPECDAQGEVKSVLSIVRDVTELKQAEQEKTALLEREKAARLELERANLRLVFLSEVSKILNSSLDYETTLSNIATIAVPGMADWCAVDFLLEERSLQRVALVHIDPEKQALGHLLQQRYPSEPGARYGIMKVFETGQPELYPVITDAMLEVIAQDAEELASLRLLGLRSALVVPLVTRANLIGVISLGISESDRRFGASDLELAEELARRAAVAIDNAWLYRQSQSLNEKLEDRVASRTAELATALKELEHFAYAVSHDLRSPLSAIKGFSQALTEDHAGELNDEAQYYLTRIAGNTERMGELIDDILMLSRVARQELRLEPTDPCELAADIARTLASNNPQRQVDFRCDVSNVVEADRGLLRIALENLLENAWKFTSKRERAVVTFTAEQLEDEVVYCLQDNGAGFDMMYASKLFQPFQRLHDASNYQGTGVGLATVKRVIERHGGRIWVESTIDKGTSFFFTLKALEDRSSS